MLQSIYMWRDMLYNFAKFTAGFLLIVGLSLSALIIAGNIRSNETTATAGEASVLQSIKSFFAN